MWPQTPRNLHTRRKKWSAPQWKDERRKRRRTFCVTLDLGGFLHEIHDKLSNISVLIHLEIQDSTIELAHESRFLNQKNDERKKKGYLKRIKRKRKRKKNKPGSEASAWAVWALRSWLQSHQVRHRSRAQWLSQGRPLLGIRLKALKRDFSILFYFYYYY